MSRQHVEIIDGMEYVVTIVPQAWRLYALAGQEARPVEPTYRRLRDERGEEGASELEPRRREARPRSGSPVPQGEREWHVSVLQS